MHPGRFPRAKILPSVFRLFAQAVLPFGQSELAASGRGTTLCVPAGQPPIADDEVDEVDDFSAAVCDLVGEDMERTGATMAMLDEHHPSEPNRFLWFIGVESAAQGRGLGSALLTSMLQRCDRDGTAAYIDATSEHNRRAVGPWFTAHVGDVAQAQGGRSR